MGKRFLALLLSALIIFTEISSGQMIASATEITDTKLQSGEDNGVSGDEGDVEIGGEEDGEAEAEEVVYFFPYWGTVDQLPTWTIDIGKQVGWESISTGEEGQIQITDITVSDKDVVSISEWEDKTGWTLHANFELGKSSEVSLGYRDKNGNPAVHKFTINVCNDVHMAGINNNSNGVGFAVPGERISLSVGYDWQKYWTDDEGQDCFGSGFEVVPEAKVTYDWSLRCGDEACDSDIATIAVDESNTTAMVSFADESENIGTGVKAVVEVSVDGEVVTTAEYYIDITDSYYYIFPIYFEDPDLEVGETLKVTPELWKVEYSYSEETGKIYKKEPIQEENGKPIRYAFYWDMDAVRITDSNNKVLSNKVFEDELWWSDAPSYTFEKLENYQTDVSLDGVVWDAEKEDYYPVTSRTWNLNELNYSIRFDDFKNYAYINEDSGEELKLALNTYLLEDKSNYELEWSIGIWDEEKEDISKPTQTGIEFDEENKNIVTLNTKEIWDKLTEGMKEQPDDIWFNICVKVLSKKTEEVSSQKVLFLLNEGINLRREREEYNFYFDAHDRLPNQDFRINKNDGDYRVWNAENPDGTGYDIEILTLTAETVEDGEDGEVLEVTPDDSGWNIRTNRMGSAIITYTYTYTYTDENGKKILGEEEHTNEMQIWVTDDVIWTNIVSSNGTSDILPGEQIVLRVDADRECYNYETEENEGAGLEGYTYQWSLEEDFGDAVSFVVDKNNPNVVTVSANADMLHRNIPVLVQIFAPGSEHPSAEHRFGLWVTDFYWELQPVELEQLDVNQSVDVNPELNQHIYNEETGEISIVPETQYVSYEWINHDDEVLEITDQSTEEKASFRLTKLKNEHVDVELVVKLSDDLGNDTEHMRRDWSFGSQNYDAWIEGINAGDHVLLWADDAEGQDVKLSVNTDNYEGKDVTIEWSFGYGNVEGDESDFDPALDELDLEGVDAYYSLNDDSTEVTLHSNALLAAIRKVNPNYGHCDVKINIKLNGETVHRFGTWIEVREARVEYNFNIGEEVVMLPYQDTGFDKNVSVYIENKEHPDGMWKDTEIESITIVEENPYTDNEHPITIEPWEDGNGWNIHANDFGDVIAVLRYKDVNGETAEREVRIYVADEVPYLEVTASAENILPGEEVIFVGSFYVEAYNEDGYYKKDCTGYEYEWIICDNELKQNVEMKQIETGDKNTSSISIKVPADERWFGRDIPVELVVYCTPEDDRDPEVIRRSYNVKIGEEYYALLPAELPDFGLAVGETMEYNPVVEYHKYGKETTTVEGVEYYWNWDPECIKITDATGKVLSIDPENDLGEGRFGVAPFRIERLQPFGGEVACNGLVKDPNNESGYSWLAGKGWNMHDYTFHFNDLRGDGYTWMYVNGESGEDYRITIQPHHYTLLENCEIKWEIGYYESNEEGTEVFVAIKPGDNTYTVNGTSIIIHSAGLLKALAGEDAENAGFTIRAVSVLKDGNTEKVMYVEEIGADIRPEVFYYFQTSDKITNVPSWQVIIEKYRTGYRENPEYPHGDEFKFEITDVRVKNANGGDEAVLSLELWEDEKGWTVTSKNLGEGIIYAEYTDITGKPATREMRVNVVDDLYLVNMFTDTSVGSVLPGHSTTMKAELLRYVYENETVSNGVVTGELVYEWYTNHEGVTITPSTENPETAQIRVAPEAEYGTDYDFDVYVDVFELNEKGEKVPRGSGTFNMYVCNGYYQLLTTDAIYAQPGEEVEIPAELRFVSVENPEGDVIENVTYGAYLASLDTDNFEIKGKTIKVAENPNITEGECALHWLVVTASTVDENGEEIYVEYYIGTALTICKHDYRLVNEQAPTCEVEGFKDYHCNICGYDKIEEVENLGHEVVTDAAVAATCTEEGKTEGSHCSRCNTVFVAQHTINAFGHTEVTDAAVAATCTTDGLTEGTHCKVCNTVTKAQTVVKALGHDEVIDAAVAATCTTPGKTEGSHCSRCNTVIKAQTSVEIAGHTHEEILTKATTSKDGSIVTKCTTCGAVDTTAVINKIATVELKTVEYTYNGKEKKPSVTVKDSKGTVLANGEDYELTYASGRKEPGRYEVTVTFIGNYEGSEKLYFTIVPKETSISSLTPDKKTFTVKWSTSTKASGYEIAYSTTEKFTKKTTKTVVVNGEKSKSKKVTGLKATEKYYVRIRTFATVTIDKKQTKLYSDWSEVETVITETAKGKISGIKSVELSDDTYKYDGKAKSPDVIIKDKAGNELEEGIDYKVSYASGRKNPGRYKVTVTYIGNYKSLKKVTLYFTITPKAVSIKKLTATSKGFKVTYAKGSGNTGYEIQYSTSKKFTKSTTKTETVSKAGTTSKTISKLKAKKTYYVRVRTYKTVKIDGKSVKLYSDWSASKSIKTKK